MCLPDKSSVIAETCEPDQLMEWTRIFSGTLKIRNNNNDKRQEQL